MKDFATTVKHIKTIAIIVAIVVVIAAGFWLFNALRTTSVSVAVDESINVTPEQIKSIKAIGEWEFLAIAHEELADTVRKGILNDDHLARIYYGTARLGINLHQVAPGWIETAGDSVTVILPPIVLLDRDFIDEARTRSFYEDGKWSHQDRDALYRKAYRMMLQRTMTPENLRTARENGEQQFRDMMRTLGFEHVRIFWRDN